jgi:hypothetical protein
MNLILLLAAIVVAYLVFTLLIRVARAAIGTALVIAVIVLVLLAIGIGPGELWQEVNQLFRSLWKLITGR